jgi:hypothetical protein
MKILKLHHLSIYSSKRRALEDETNVYLLYFLYTSSTAELMEWVLVVSSYQKEMATEIPCNSVTKMDEPNLT